MKKTIKTWCNKCHGKGKVFNPMLKVMVKCHTCTGTGEITKVVDVPQEREESCPDDCHGCPEEKYNECMDSCIVYPSWNSMSEEVKKNHKNMACMSPVMAALTIDRLRYPNNRIRMTDQGYAIILNDGEKDVPPAIDPGKADIETALMCYAVIGASFRSGALKI